MNAEPPSPVVSAGDEARIASALDRLTGHLATDLEAVNRLIIEHMVSPVPLVQDLAAYIVHAGGKRFRPLLTLAAASLVGYAGTRQHGLAACVEFIHTATLLHDDVVDGSDQRRGLASANAVFGNQASVLVGDFLFARAFQLMVADGSLLVLKILCDAAAVIAEGEVLQLSAANDLRTDEAAYLRVITAKTAALFAAAAEVGAVVAQRPAAEAAALRRYGLNLGIAFQIVDDVLDYTARENRFGKAIGDDFREGKPTLPVVLAVARADAAERAFWERTMERLEQDEADLAQALALMERHGALAESMARAETFGAEAVEALAAFPPSPLRDLMADLVGFCIRRGY